MSLVKETLIDKVEFVGQWRCLQVRNKVVVKENNNIISETFSRDSYYPGDEDHEDFPEILVPYITGVWTESLISDYKAYQSTHAGGGDNPQIISAE
jgi:hypothetical protein